MVTRLLSHKMLFIFTHERERNVHKHSIQTGYSLSADVRMNKYNKSADVRMHKYDKIDEIKSARSVKKKANMNSLSSELSFTSKDGGLLIMNVMTIINERIGCHNIWDSTGKNANC